MIFIKLVAAQLITPRPDCLNTDTDQCCSRVVFEIIQSWQSSYIHRSWSNSAVEYPPGSNVIVFKCSLINPITGHDHAIFGEWSLQCDSNHRIQLDRFSVYYRSRNTIRRTHDTRGFCVLRGLLPGEEAVRGPITDVTVNEEDFAPAAGVACIDAIKGKQTSYRI